MTKRWGVLGIGRVTTRMVAAIRSASGHEIAWAAGRDAGKLARWGHDHQVAQLTTDFERVVSSPDVDIVYIALPPSLHEEWSVRAMRCGKRVLCEKPLAQSSEGAARMFAASTESKLPLNHATAFAHHPRSHAMREVVRGGELGEIRRVTVACSVSGILDRAFDHRHDLSAGGGCLLDLGWYCVYATLWFTGLAPLEWTAYGTRVREGDPSSVWKQVQGMARLQQGAIASWDCGYDAAGRKWIEIAGTKASLICDDFLRPWDVAKPRYWVHGQDGKARCELIGEGVFQEAHLVEHAAQASLEESLESMSMGVATQRILDGVEQSAEDRRAIDTRIA